MKQKQQEANQENDFNPYDYKTDWLTDEEFKEGFDSEDEADMFNQLIDLSWEARKLCDEMESVLDNYEGEEVDGEKIKKLRTGINDIREKLENFLYV